MNSLIYNYFSNFDEWNEYVKGNWNGKGISMIPSTIQPYETGDETTVIWKSNAKETKSHFKRGKSEFSLTWLLESEVLCDKIKLIAKDADWECEIQAMTRDRFHLHVLPISDKSKILYSGVVTKKKGLFSFL
ncbi:hypothetical protein LEP1GSC203_1640 [Leptospira terpstrae serovar Hualin str. LT 11-33 = ATCC 700639]|uniref:Uncharacterized protein n=2 Tax=Leptospira TaxID=171 RepID=N1W0E1_9LEPT|nr:hypothetical protein LEP1GSC203_1640 [Leptospira terpstrae serovar Hualin str. LT 11-33 = ATCC 700639]